jgi:glycosyltransferase involved in cell wall biosynthesis
MNFCQLIQKNLSSPSGRLLILGEEGTDPLAGIVSRITYTFKEQLPDLKQTVDFVRTSTCFDLLRIGKNLNPISTFDYFYGFVSEGGLIVVDAPNFSPPLSLGRTSVIYQDKTKTLLRREPVEQKIKFAIVMATYYRKAGTSRAFVERSIKSIRDQTYQNFKLFLIGDKYEHEEEFTSFKELLPSDKIETVNLPIAWERENCKNRHSLWCVGGATAMNRGLDLAVEQGFTHYVHLDDDDYWHPFHLRNVAMGYTQFPEATFVCTSGVMVNHSILPAIKGLGYNNFNCAACSVFHSAYGFRLDIHPYRYPTYVIGQKEPTTPADAVMLNLIGEACRRRDLKTLAIPLLTCLHDFEANPNAKISTGASLLIDLFDEMKRSRSDRIFKQRLHFIYDLRTLLGPDPINYHQVGIRKIDSILNQHPYKSELSDKEMDLLFITSPYNEEQLSKILKERTVKKGGIIVIDDYLTSFAATSVVDEVKFKYETIEKVPNLFEVDSPIVDEYNICILRRI